MKDFHFVGAPGPEVRGEQKGQAASYILWYRQTSNEPIN